MVRSVGPKQNRHIARPWTPQDEVPGLSDPFVHRVVAFDGDMPSTAHALRTWTDIVRMLAALGTGRPLRWVPGHDVPPRGRGRPTSRAPCKGSRRP
jgi:hypothetical protein